MLDETNVGIPVGNVDVQKTDDPSPSEQYEMENQVATVTVETEPEPDPISESTNETELHADPSVADPTQNEGAESSNLSTDDGNDEVLLADDGKPYWRKAADDCPEVGEGVDKKTLTSKWGKVKYGRCELCGLALKSDGTHRKRRNDAGKERGSYKKTNVNI